MLNPGKDMILYNTYPFLTIFLAETNLNKVEWQANQRHQLCHVAACQSFLYPNYFFSLLNNFIHNTNLIIGWQYICTPQTVIYDASMKNLFSMRKKYMKQLYFVGWIKICKV